MHKAIEIKKGIYWVGAVDWNVRNFHGYTTSRGTTYNAYLVLDEQPTLIDTVKAPFREEMLERIASVLPPSEIRLHVSNHAEPDHSGALPGWMAQFPGTRIICSKKGAEALEAHYHAGWKLEIPEEGAPVSIGRRSLRFFPIPLVHWPDSMATYLPEDKILFPNDAFGQHLASLSRFEDEMGLELVLDEAAKYYANIVMPFAATAARALDKMGPLEFDMIAPSHGVIWRKNPGEIIKAYRRWIAGEAPARVLVIYDTMWGSTEKMALAIAEGVRAQGAEARVFNLTVNDRSEILREVLDARGLAIGSPTLNTNLFPTIAAFLCYLRGLKPKNKKGLAFGSFGWSGEGARQIDQELEAMKIERIAEPKSLKYVPTAADLESCVSLGAQLAKSIM